MFKTHKVIDAHCHIYPAKIAAKAVEGIGGFYDLKMDEKGIVSDMLEKGERAGVDRHIVFSVATKPAQVQSINEFIAGEAQRSGGKLVGLGTVHPDSADMAGDIAHLKELGLKGIKIHPDFQKTALDDPRFIKMYALCGKELPVLIHTGDKRYDYSNPDRMQRVLEMFPDTTFIGAHFGGWSIWEQACDALAGYENFYVDTSSSFYALAPEIVEKMIARYGEDHVVFGTDYPMWRADSELEYFSHLNLSDTAREKILHLNIEKILKI